MCVGQLSPQARRRLNLKLICGILLMFPVTPALLIFTGGPGYSLLLWTSYVSPIHWPSALCSWGYAAAGTFLCCASAFMYTIRLDDPNMQIAVFACALMVAWVPWIYQAFKNVFDLDGTLLAILPIIHTMMLHCIVLYCLAQCSHAPCYHTPMH